MKLLMHPAVIAVGFAVLACLGLIAPLIDAGHLWMYHDDGSPAAIFLPVLIDIFLLWLILTIALLAARRPGRVRVFVWSGLVLAIPCLILQDGVLLGAWNVSEKVSTAILLASFVCWMTVVVFFKAVPPAVLERVWHFANTVFAFSSLSAFLVIGQIFWCFWQARANQTVKPSHLAAPARVTRPSARRPRVVWIIFDELSFQQVYERRFAGLALPTFDGLAAQSTVFTGVLPAAYATEVAIPSLISGVATDRVRASASGDALQLHDPKSGAWRTFDVRRTVFQDSLDSGYTPAVAGWYLPYCSMLARRVAPCFWVHATNYDKGMSSHNTVWANVLAPWYRIALYLGRRDHGKPEIDREFTQLHIADYRALLAAGDAMLQDDSVDFLLLHMPIPHPGGIYDRTTHELTTRRSSYIDNLALADRYLAHVRGILESRKEWDSSAVLVMADHSWRTSNIWRPSSFWTPEDEAASLGGQFDPRPAYVVKLPYQTEGARIQEPFDAIRTRSLLQGIFAGRIQTAADISAFAAGSAGK